MIAILGSGFGLYGYLPALVGGCGQRVVLPESYRARFCERPELARFAGSVQWERDAATALDCAEGVVIALRPLDQNSWIDHCLEQVNIRRLVLEKPLADSPETAAVLSGGLDRSRKVVRMGYTFRYTPWGKQLKDSLRGEKESRAVSIQWRFLAYHFRHDLKNWKRFSVSGGGAIRFYGIQLIALLAEIGYRDVISSRSFGPSVNEVEKWTASFAGSRLPKCDILINTRAGSPHFYVELLAASSLEVDAVLANLTDPFDPMGEACPQEGLDRRVPALTSLCCSLWEQSTEGHSWYEHTINLWRFVEENTQFQITNVV